MLQRIKKPGIFFHRDVILISKTFNGVHLYKDFIQYYTSLDWIKYFLNGKPSVNINV